MLEKLKSLKTMKDIKSSDLEILRFRIQCIKDLKSYKFGGVKLEYSPARFVTRKIDGVPKIVIDSEPTLRDVIRFMHAYVDYITEFIPEILNDCTHPWSPLASRTIDPITLL